MKKNKIKAVLTSKVFACALTGVVCLGLGSAFGFSSTGEVQQKLDKEVKENHDLQKKVDEAKPYFEMKQVDQEKMEEKAKEEQQKLKQEKQEKANKQVEEKIKAMTKTFSSGNYVVGKDFPQGIYNIIAVEGAGSGNVYCGGNGLNTIMGYESDPDLDKMCQKRYNNVPFKNGQVLEISDTTIKLVPSR